MSSGSVLSSRSQQAGDPAAATHAVDKRDGLRLKSLA